MLHLVIDRKGFGMIEVLIAVFMTAVAILAVFSLVSPAWKTTAKSDYLGRASGILYEQLMVQESRLMNPCCSVTTGVQTPLAVYASGQAGAQSGDLQFNVATTITELSTGVWRVIVTVTWTGHPGITESLVVTRQDGFTFPSGCTAGGSACQ